MSKWRTIQQEIKAQPKPEKPAKPVPKPRPEKNPEKPKAPTPDTQEAKADDKKELNTFIHNHEAQKARHKRMGDPNYYFFVCCKDEEELRQCCEMIDVNPEYVFVDGQALCKRLGIALSPPDTMNPNTRSTGSDYVERSLEKDFYSTTIFYPEEVVSMNTYFKLADNATDTQKRYMEKYHEQMERNAR